MAKTKIEWTESSWNPVTGCTKISDGCLNCYAERMARRLQAMGQVNYRQGFNVTLHHDALNRPLTWKKSQMVFVCSMGDLFHDCVPIQFIERIFYTMRSARQHTFQVLTKRSQKLAELSETLIWKENIWAGVTVENSNYVYRINDLLATEAAVKFLSLEPLLGPIDDIDLDGIDWVIVGGESGPGARPINPEWVKQIRDICNSTDTPFFFKQWGGINKKRAGRLLEGRTWDQIPVTAEMHLALDTL